jgi:hypothetical protein
MRFGVTRGLAAALVALGIATPGLAQNKTAAIPLYSLDTDCSVNGEVNRCKVEAFDAKGTTLYRTTINGNRISFRLLDLSELRGAQIWDKDAKTWVGLDRLSLDFETNTLCLNGEALCFNNPNYFASLREQYPELRSDLIKARFNAKDGRLTAICYSQEACDAGF